MRLEVRALSLFLATMEENVGKTKLLQLQAGGGAGSEEYTHGGVRKTKFEPRVPSSTTKRRLKKKLSTTPVATGDQAHEPVVPRELQRLLQQVDSSDRPHHHHSQRPAASKVTFGFPGSSKSTTHTTTSSGFGPKRAAAMKQEFLQAHQDPVVSVKSEGFGNSKSQGFEVFKSDEQSFKTEDRFDHEKYYPVTLPLRKPGEEEPRLLDEEEEKEDENAAHELGLDVDRNHEDALFFFQFPKGLPVLSQGKKQAGKMMRLEDLAGGSMGKLLVYESGAVKLRVGEVVLDALPGTECAFAQEVAAVNVAAKRCGFVGEVHKRVVLTPDVADVVPDLRGSIKP